MINCRLCGERTNLENVYNHLPAMLYPGSVSLEIHSCPSCNFYQSNQPFDTPHGEPINGFYHNIIEHFNNPNKFIRNLPNGILTLTCPNLDFILKEKCFQEFTPIHISYFNMKTLTYAFEKNFFLVLGCYPINNGQDLEIRVKRPKVAIWGAGHRSLTWMAWNKWLKPEYVIDSNPAKQGTKTAITGYPIVAPKTLLTKKVDMLIVSVPGKYPEEVLKQIRDMKLDLIVRKLC